MLTFPQIFFHFQIWAFWTAVFSVLEYSIPNPYDQSSWHLPQQSQQKKKQNNVLNLINVSVKWFWCLWQYLDFEWLTLSRFHLFFGRCHYWSWISKCWLGECNTIFLLHGRLCIFSPSRRKYCQEFNNFLA